MIRMISMIRYSIFIKKILGRSYPIRRGECKEKWSAWIHNNTCVYISSGFEKCDPVERRAMLLHECGHIVEGINYQNLIDTEARADLWAINKGKELGLKEEVELIKSWVKYWASVNDKDIWNSNRRRYVLAARLVQKVWE